MQLYDDNTTTSAPPKIGPVGNAQPARIEPQSRAEAKGVEGGHVRIYIQQDNRANARCPYMIHILQLYVTYYVDVDKIRVANT